MKRKCTLALLASVAGLAATTLINGAGATFPAPIYSRWFYEFHKAHADVQINYQSLGSGAGIQQVTEGTVDFGASDLPLTDEQLKTYRDKHGSAILLLPTVAGGAVPTYNVEGVGPGLNFTARALAGIYLGAVTKWSDPEIAKANPRVKLPNADIVVVHRSDGSGTTYCFTDFLSKVSPEWRSKPGKGASVNWPVGIGAKGNEGVTGQVKNTPNSVGYVELIYALQNSLPYGNVQNSAGKFVKPDLASIRIAAQAAAKTMPEDFRVSITNGSGAEVYPISTFTWLLVPQKFRDAAKATALKEFLRWMLSTGQNSAEALSYVRLPNEIAARELKAIEQIQ